MFLRRRQAGKRGLLVARRQDRPVARPLSPPRPAARTVVPGVPADPRVLYGSFVDPTPTPGSTLRYTDPDHFGWVADSEFPFRADGVWSPTSGATVALGSDTVTVGGAAFTAADIGKRFTMMLGGSAASFAGGNINNPGTGYRAGDVVTVAGTTANVWSVTSVGTPVVVSGGSGGPANGQFIVKGLSVGRRGRRDAARIMVRTNASGVVPTDGTGIVEVTKGGTYIDPAFTGVNESFTSRDFPGLTGLVITMALGANEIRRNAACFYGRITGTALTIEQLVYGTPAVGNTLSGIEVTEGTTITAGAGLSWTISNAHSNMNGNTFLFIAESVATTTSPAAGSLPATGGSGSGLTLAVSWRGRPLAGNIIAVPSSTQVRLNAAAASSATNVGYCYGTDYGPAIQAALDAGQEVILPSGVVCHSTPLVFKNKSRLIGRGSALGNNANTVLAYVGAFSSRGKQLSGDTEISGNIDGCVIGDCMLWGNNLIGIGYYQRGVSGSQLRPLSVRGHTYIGVQLSGAPTGSSTGNIHSHLVVREADSPGWDTTGIYLGPGVATGTHGGVYDVCRTRFPYWQVDVDPEGFGRAVWYRVADSNSHGFLKARGAGDLPTIEFASHDTQNSFARAIHITSIDAAKLMLRGGAFPAEVNCTFQNFYNGGQLADVDGTPEAAEANDEDDPEVVTEFGARFFGIASNGTINAPRLQPYHFDSRQQPKKNSWMVTPLVNSNTWVPGAEITAPGLFEVLAYTDANEVLRVMAPTSPGTYTVATLPAGRPGARAIVSDATAPAFLAAPVGGGAVRAPVFWDDSGGGAWKVG